MAQAEVVEPKVKGVAVREFLRWYTNARGTETLDRLLPTLPSAWQRQLTPGVPALGLLAGTWYPASLIHRLLDAITHGLRSAERAALVREASHAAIEATLQGVYRMLFQAMMSPDRYARNAQQLFSRYFNTGVMSKTLIDTPHGPGHLSVIRNWTSHHPLLCDMLAFTAEYVYGELGCRDLAIKKTGCVSTGQAECTFVITWRKVA